ncbi:hypothetical protein [Dendrosporobacter sp. 1207_IL3150]|uniref:hypothetical protein n=1 Tax=Dendrosporobacter sp. 1207_IL3150 TaxID=3084054 RepID=UPI002FD9AC4E
MKKINSKVISIVLIALLVLVIAGCTNKGNNQSDAEQNKQQSVEDTAAKEKLIMDNYYILTQRKDVTIPEVITYIDTNIQSVTQQTATNMVIGLEKLQKEKLPMVQEYFDSGPVQSAIAKGYANGLSDSYIGAIQNKEVREVLQQTRNSAFKIETAEGMYFPVMDYSFYKKYHNYVTPDIAAYIDILAVESEKTPAKDAALRISWDEIIQRALAQEKFIKDYGNSVRAPEMRQLLKQYASFALFGTNNTPLFNYETKLMRSEAKKSYYETKFDPNNGSFSKVMGQYILIVSKNNYKLTNEVNEYRTKAAEDIR